MGLRQDLIERRGTLEERRKNLAQAYTEAGPELDMGLVKCIDGDSAAKVEKMREWNAEINDLADQVAKLAQDVKDADRRAKVGDDDGPGEGLLHPGKGTAAGSSKSLGDLFIESEGYKGKKGPVGPQVSITAPDDLKTLFETGGGGGAGWTPETTRTGRLVDFATRPIQVIDLIPSTRTSQQSVVFMEETTFTNNAAEVAEAGTYGEAALALTERSSAVRKIGVWLPVTDEQLEDEAQARGYINNRLPFMIRQRLDSQILVGNGTAPNLRGILNVVGIQAQAKGADPTPDAVYKAMTLVRVTGRAMPTGFIIHPTDWQDVKLLRTADGIYIWGNPSEATPDRIWGLNVVLSDAITLNTGLVGDFAQFSELAMKRDVEMQITNSHSTFFIEGKQALRADLRAALVIYRPAAFCTVTGI